MEEHWHHHRHQGTRHVVIRRSAQGGITAQLARSVGDCAAATAMALIATEIICGCAQGFAWMIWAVMCGA